MYKHVYIIDCSGLSMRLLGGSKRHAISNSLGKVSVLYPKTKLKMHTLHPHRIYPIRVQVSQYYPETMLKMFLVNTPRVFPMIWKVRVVYMRCVCSNRVLTWTWLTYLLTNFIHLLTHTCLLTFWKALQPMIDPVSAAKISILGNLSSDASAQAELVRAGVDQGFLEALLKTGVRRTDA